MSQAQMFLWGFLSLNTSVRQPRQAGGAPALSQMVVGMARSAAANESMARLRLPGVVAAASPT